MAKYQPLIPTGNVDLSEDYLNIQNNFSQNATTIGIDHFPPQDTTSNNGYHKVIHMVANSTATSNPPNNYPISPVPVPVGLTGELFTAQSNDGFNLDETLYYQTGGGNLIQMTRNFLPSSSAVSPFNGKTFLPGGIVIQWGLFTGLTNINTNTKSWPTPFPANCFVAFLQGIKTSGNGGDGIFVQSVSNTNCVIRNGSGTITSCYFLAIGI